MRFYIATGLVNAEHARKAAEVLRRNGHEQTYDWTTHGDIRHEGAERMSDARPSDAIALAVRSNAPMFVEDDIMNRLGTVSTHAEEVDDEQEFEKFDEFVHTLSPDDF